MPREQVALLMTVGTGIGKNKEKARAGLGYAMYRSIDSKNPDRVILFGSEESKYTVEALKEEYLKEKDRELDYYEFIQVDEIDSFKKYFTAIKNVVTELESEYKIIIDYTYGTKTMTMSAAMVSMLFGKELIFVTGERKDGIVVKGTEEVKNQNLFSIYDEFTLENIENAFNANRFETALNLLSNIVDPNIDKVAYYKLIQSYSHFDNVNYEEAFKYFDVDLFREVWPHLAQDFAKNRLALTNLNKKSDKKKDYYLLASMINNARRRYEEHKYDDAIARLYRSLELIGQIYLKKYGLDSSNIDISSLKDRRVSSELIDELEKLRTDGKIKIGLIKDFEVVSQINPQIGDFYAENGNWMKNIVTFRNNSILAHGMEAKTAEEYEEFKDFIYALINVMDEKIFEYIEETKFPILR